MDDEPARTRVITTNGTNYIVKGDVDGNRARWEDAVQDCKITIGFTITPAEDLFPSTPFYIRTECIESIQGVSHEAWVWQKQAEARHFASALRDLPGEQVDAFKQMVEAMRPEDENE